MTESVCFLSLSLVIFIIERLRSFLMKKFYIYLVGLSVLSMSLAGCGIKPHEHTWGTPTYTWSDDYSSCTAESTCTQDSTHKESQTAHSKYEVITESSCEDDGLGRYIASFDKSPFTMQTHDIVIEAFGHDYQFDSFVWTDFTARAKYICSIDSDHIAYHDATMTSVVTTAPLCESSGIRTYTATYGGHSDTKTEVLSSLGHNWGTPTYTWSNDYSSCTAERVCVHDSSHIESETVNSTYVVLTKPTTKSEGLGRYTAPFTKTPFVTQTHDVTLDKLEPYHGEKPILSKNGKTITYGLYPQTNVNDSDLISKLDTLTTPESNGWYLYDDEYYAKLIASPYEASYEFDNGTKITSGATYWFKCEPITWNVLSNTNGKYYIFSNVLLDAHCYHNSTSSRTIDGKTVYANNYEHSDIRKWLNSDFYNSAFALDNSYIQTTTVDNSASTTHSSSNSYACNNTQDKVFLPSYQDYINSSYDFSTSSTSTDSRYCTTTDWARARGAYYNYSTHMFYNGYYWTRSPYSEYCNVWYVNYNGAISNCNVNYTDFSVRPSLSIKIA